MSKDRYFHTCFINGARYCRHPDYHDFMGWRFDISICFWLNDKFEVIDWPWFAGMHGPKHKYGSMIRETEAALIGLYEALDMSPPQDPDWLKWREFRMAFGQREGRIIRPKFYAPRYD